MKLERELFVLKFRMKNIGVIGLILLGAVSIAVVFGSFFFVLKGFFSIIGVTYESNSALLWFIFYCFLIGIIFEIIEVVILFFIKKAKLHKKEQWIWIALVKFALTWGVIHVVNELMTTITLSSFAEVLTALLIVSVEFLFDDEEEDEKEV